MNKISCDICMDLLPLVADHVASEDSKNAVLAHIETCERCKLSFEEMQQPPMHAAKVDRQIKKRLLIVALALVGVGAALGISIADGALMFYNIIIMPTIGAISFFALKKKCLYVLALVFASVYLRWLPDTFGYIWEGQVAQALLLPLWWSVIYASLFVLGMLIGFLLYFGCRKERGHEKDS